MGSAPAARILAIRAFGTASNGAESTSFVILRGLDYAAAHGAQIVNMSFAGPKDALIERGIAALAAKGIVMVAAAGNAGAKSPPLYPAANPNVIAVSATDAQDRLFTASNRGGYIAVAAPGVDIFLPAPDEKYQMTSGTSFSAAYISGLAALVLERNPALKPDELRAILMKTARDLGAPGRDDLFGAGEADAYAAVSAVVTAPAPPVPVGGAMPPAAEKASDRQQVPATRALNAAGTPPWRPTSRPPAKPRSPRRAIILALRKSPAKKVKKIAGRFERAATPAATNICGSGNPSPTRLYPARAPIHPKRPYSLTRPVVPPDGSFVFGGMSGGSTKRNRPVRIADGRRPQGSPCRHAA